MVKLIAWLLFVVAAFGTLSAPQNIMDRAAAGGCAAWWIGWAGLTILGVGGTLGWLGVALWE